LGIVEEKRGGKGRRLQEEHPNGTLLPTDEQQTHNFLFNLILL
jgi:hypothetical protein